LWRVARKTFPKKKLERYDRLLARNSEGTITPKVRADLRALRLETEKLMVRKAHAYALLKWRGYALPALDRIPRPA
jgi:hypothetical protein